MAHGGSYYGQGVQSSIVVTGGVVALDSVRPDRCAMRPIGRWPNGKPRASAAWRRTKPTRIVSLRLAGAGRSIDVFDAGDPRIPTHHIAHDGIAARLVKDRDNWPFASIARADLARLRTADVRQLEWAGAASGSTVQPAGCVQFR